MAENQVPTLKVIPLFNKHVAAYYLRNNKNGKFYVLTDTRRTLRVSVERDTLTIRSFREGSVASTVHYAELIPGSSRGAKTTHLGQLGEIRFVIFASQSMRHNEDALWDCAAHHSASLAASTQPDWQSVDYLTEQMLQDSAATFYIKVKKPRALFASTFEAKFANGRLEVRLLRYTANARYGMPELAPQVFMYRPGGNLILRSAGKSGERVVGSIVSIIRTTSYLSRDVILFALVAAIPPATR